MIILYSGKYPGVSAGAKRIALYQKGLEEANFEVKVISTFRPSSGRLSYYFNLFLQPFIVVAIIMRHHNKHKLLFVYGYDWFLLLLILLVTKIRRQKMVLEINEKPGACYRNRLTELPIIKALNLIFLTRFSLPLIDGFVVISEQLRDYLVPLKNVNAKIFKIPIIIDPDIDALPKKACALHTPFLLHAGALSERKDGIVGVFKAFAIANKQLDSALHFYLTDRTSPAEVWKKIKSIINENSLNDLVHFTGILTEDELLCYQQQCSMLILNKPDNEQNRYNFPTKLGEYLRLKKPVIYTHVGEMAHYLKDGFNAFKVPVDQPNVLAETILSILDNKENASIIAANGFALAQNHFNFKMQGKRLKQFFEEIL